MIPVAEAQALCLDGFAPGPTEIVPLADAAGRVLRADVQAHRAQPPFAASAMDGYAVDGRSLAPGQTFVVVGEAAAGHIWQGQLDKGQALRIFTGAPVPDGADHVIIQEDVEREGDVITVTDNLGDGTNIRPAGADFPQDFALSAPRVLTANHLALLAAMNVPRVTVSRKPTVALIATGDELVMPGGDPKPDQIIASNVFALKAMIDATGGTARILPIAADNEDALRHVFALASDADIVVTIGGASVGDHDLVAKVSRDIGFTPSFHKIAMRPGKPLMLGHKGETPFLGLPGNPVSAIVCGHLFLLPMIRQRLAMTQPIPLPLTARLDAPLGPNGPREHYMRARIKNGGAIAFDRQDSSLLSILTEANGLLIRPPHDPAQDAGALVRYLPI